MTRESSEMKGRRYVVEGRLVIERVDGDSVEARCRGNGQVYRIAHDRRGWWCDCPARGRCAHVVATQLVTVVNQRNHMTHSKETP